MAKNRALPKHLLVARMSAMGDVAMLPHAINALKAAYPDVKITVAARPLFQPFFASSDVEFLPLDIRRDYPDMKGLRLLARKLLATGIDAYADVHNVWRSWFLRILLHNAGVRTSHIRKNHLRKWLASSVCRSDAAYLKHTVVRYCDTFRALGFEFADPLPPVKSERPDPMPELKGTRIGFAPFSAHTGKTCPDPLRRRIAELLSERFDHVFIHGGKGSEAEFAREMAAKYPNVTAVADCIDGLAAEMDLISHLDCMVSMDSLAMHLSSLTATPVVSIWGSTHPKLGYLGYGCDRAGIVQCDLKCRPCSTYGNKACKYGTYECLYAVDPMQVADRVEQMISSAK